MKFSLLSTFALLPQIQALKPRHKLLRTIQASTSPLNCKFDTFPQTLSPEPYETPSSQIADLISKATTDVDPTCAYDVPPGECVRYLCFPDYGTAGTRGWSAIWTCNENDGEDEVVSVACADVAPYVADVLDKCETVYEAVLCTGDEGVNGGRCNDFVGGEVPVVRGWVRAESGFTVVVGSNLDYC